MRCGAMVILCGVCAIAACAHTNAVPFSSTPMDDVCDPRNGSLSPPLDTFRAGWAAFTVQKGWASAARSAPRLELRRVDSELFVSEGEIAPVPFEAPLRNATARCTLRRGDTTVVITAMRWRGTGFRVTAWWETEIDGPIQQMELRTTSREQLKLMRGTIESLRFPIDSARVAAKRRAPS